MYSLFFRFFSHRGYHRILSRVPRATFLYVRMRGLEEKDWVFSQILPTPESKILQPAHPSSGTQVHAHHAHNICQPSWLS